MKDRHEERQELVKALGRSDKPMLLDSDQRKTLLHLVQDCGNCGYCGGRARERSREEAEAHARAIAHNLEGSTR